MFGLHPVEPEPGAVLPADAEHHGLHLGQIHPPACRRSPVQRAVHDDHRPLGPALTVPHGERREVAAGADVQRGDVLDARAGLEHGRAAPDRRLHVIGRGERVVALGPLTQDQASPVGSREVGAGALHVGLGPPRGRPRGAGGDRAGLDVHRAGEAGRRSSSRYVP